MLTLVSIATSCTMQCFQRDRNAIQYVVCSTCVGANEVVLLDVDDDGDLDAIVSSQVRGWAECVPV